VLDRLPVAVGHAAFDTDALAGDVRGDEIIAGEIRPWITPRRRQAIIEERTNRLRWRDAGHVNAPSASGCAPAARCRSDSPMPSWRRNVRDRTTTPCATSPSRPAPI